MNREFFRTFVGGALIGAILFFAPFMVLNVLVFFLIFRIIFFLFKGRGHKKHLWAYADRIRNMSDDEYQNYKANYRSCGGWRGK